MERIENIPFAFAGNPLIIYYRKDVRSRVGGGNYEGGGRGGDGVVVGIVREYGIDSVAH